MRHATAPPAMAIGAFAVLLSACGREAEEALPPIPRPALFQEPSTCVPVPPPPPMPPDLAPADPRRCLGPAWSGRGLPVDMRIVDGRVVEFEFYDQCSGDRFTVPSDVRECIANALATWRYPTWPTCPGQRSSSHDMLYLEPLRASVKIAGDIKRGCSG
jgi:hypothetical protein